MFDQATARSEPVLPLSLLKHRKPEYIRSDNGREFIAGALPVWLTKVAGKAHRHLSDTSLNYLEDQLAKLGTKPVLVTTHHPPVLTGIKKMNIQNLRDSQRQEEILSNQKGEMRLVCGHMHRNIVAPFGSVICQIAPGASHVVSMDQREGAPNCLTHF